MVGSSETRTLCPSILFLYAYLGASLSVSRTFCPSVEGFMFKRSSLGVVLADLVPLLLQSINWFEDLVGEGRGMSEVRSSELETSCRLVTTLWKWRKILRLLAQGRSKLSLPLGKSVA